MRDTSTLGPESQHRPARVLSFGRFRLLTSFRRLEKDGVAFEIGGRALDILIALADRAGEVVSKTDLMATVWPGINVEEGTLRVHMTLLRKALGDSADGTGFITTVPGRGYSFAPPPAPTAVSRPPRILAPPEHRRNALPARPHCVVGREDVVENCIAHLRTHRFVTIVGPGGIGKTTVAVSMANALVQEFDGAVSFVDLSPISDPDLVPLAVGSALGLALLSTDPFSVITDFVGSKRELIVLDNCEHVVDSAATLLEWIFRTAPNVFLLATSREVLQVEGEHVFWLQPLESPPDLAVDVAGVTAFSAARLFLDRLAAGSSEFRLTDADAPLVGSICRKLDGIPLAIEIAAGRAHALGLGQIDAALNDRPKLSWKGRRTAFRRHQTMEWTFDWSYELLDAAERTVFSRLSIFAGSFSLAGATAVAASGDDDTVGICTVLRSLVSKSMLIRNFADEPMVYRLLAMARAYGAQKLAESGEQPVIERRRALFVRRTLVDAGREAELHKGFDWHGVLEREINDLRAALDWSGSEDGDPDILIDLTTSAVPMLIATHMYLECQQWCQRALALSEGRSAVECAAQMPLLIALGITMPVIDGFKNEGRLICEKSLRLAGRLGDQRQATRARFGLYLAEVFGHSAVAALRTAREFITDSESRHDDADVACGHRMAGAARLYMGELRDAQRDLELSSQGYRMAGLRAGSISHFNGELQTRSRQAEVLWLLGFLDQAALTCDEMLRDTLAFGTDSICFAALMYPSIPMAIHMKRDSEEARRLITVFTQYHSRLVSGWGRAAVGAYEAVVDVVCDGAMCSLPKLATAISGIRAAGATVFLLQFLGILAEGLGRAGRLCEARAAIEEALALAGAGGFLWWLPELRRIKAGLIRISNTPFADASAENWYRDAIDCARRQDSLWLELRGAIGLVELSGRDGRIGDARDILASVYGRFTEGFDFHDLRRARALLAAPGDTAEERQVIPSNCLQTAP